MTIASVPHHRVDSALHARARDLANQAGISLSQVAEAGLIRYVEHSPAISAVQPPVRSTRLPDHIVTALSTMRAVGDSTLDNALAALHDAGWSYATLAQPVGLTRQAVHLRVGKATPGWPLATSVPEGPARSRKQTSASTRFDWAVWVDRAIYVAAVDSAKQRGDIMRDVMESILSDYVSGAFAVETADVHPNDSTEKKAQA